MQREIIKPLTPKQALEQTPFNDLDTIYKYLSEYEEKGKIKATKLGKRWAIQQKDLDKFLYGNKESITEQKKEIKECQLRKEVTSIGTTSASTRYVTEEAVLQKLRS